MKDSEIWNRFVILDHQPPKHDEPLAADLRSNRRHFDVMLQRSDQGALITLAMHELPTSPETDIQAQRIADHDARYLTFEGEVSRNRGTVKRIAFGYWSGNIERTIDLKFDTLSREHAGESWQLCVKRGYCSPSADSESGSESESAGGEADAGTFLSLKRLL